MGYEKGTVFFYKNKFWLFWRYSTDKEHYQTYILHGLNGEVIEPRADECEYIIGPSEIKLNGDDE